MKKIILSKFLKGLFLIPLSLLLSCSDSDNGSYVYPRDKKIESTESIYFTSEEITLKVGEETAISVHSKPQGYTFAVISEHYTVSIENNDIAEVIYKSSSSKSSIRERAYIKGIAPGTTKLEVIYTNLKHEEFKASTTLKIE